MWTYLWFLSWSVVSGFAARIFEWAVDNFYHDNLKASAMTLEYLWPIENKIISFLNNSQHFHFTHDNFTALWYHTKIYKIQWECHDIANNFWN